MNDIPQPYRRYLRLLGIRNRPAGINGLEEIVLRHLCAVPFENVSKLQLLDRDGVGRPFALGEFLDGIELRDLGGTCYSSNPFVFELLNTLGYDAVLLGADMNNPDVHTSVRVTVDAVDYHVDMGYAAPFRRPIRLDRLPYEVVQGDFRYVLDRRANDGRFEMSMLSGGEWKHGYVVNETPRAPGFFDKAVRESYWPDSEFMRRFRIVRFFEEHTVEIRDRTAFYFLGDQTRKVELTDIAELERVVFEDMQLPRCPVRDAIGVLERVTGEAFFVRGGDSS
jgi:arylamine N-acetyltransferase